VVPWEALIGDKEAFGNSEVFEGIDGLPEQVLDPIVIRSKKRYWSRISASFGDNAENMSGGGWGQPSTARSHTISSVSNPDETCAFITATDWLALHSGCRLWERSPVEGKSENSKIAYLEHAMEEMNFSARAHDRILKVARTLADLTGALNIRATDILEAIQYRSLDRKLFS